MLVGPKLSMPPPPNRIDITEEAFRCAIYAVKRTFGSFLKTAVTKKLEEENLLFGTKKYMRNFNES